MKVSRSRAILGWAIVASAIVLFFASAYFNKTAIVYASMAMMAVGSWVAGCNVTVGD